MDVQARRKPVPGRENVVLKSVKSTMVHDTVRSALGEVGNKIHSRGRQDAVVPSKKLLPKENSTWNIKPVVHVKPTVKAFDAGLDSYTVKQLSIIDPDEDSKNDPQMATEYLSDIFNYLRELEDRFPIEKHFLKDHTSTPKMRTILVNWLVEVHQNFKLCLETFHLCIGILDRYLQCNTTVGRDTLQLVGISAMLVASKYEEMYIPDIEDFVYICDNTFSKKQVLRMEYDILKKLNYNLGRPYPILFLRRYNKIAQVDVMQHNLGKYLLELALLDYNMAHIKPSLLAAAACCLSKAIMDNVKEIPKIWTPTLKAYTSYEYNDFKFIMYDLANLAVKSIDSKYQAIITKYAQSKYGKVSLNPKLNGILMKRLADYSQKFNKK